MKAAVLRQIGKPLTIEDVPKPTVGPNDVLVETRTCGLCRTDLHIYDGLAYVPQLPHIPGHEPAGVVAQIGENVSRFKVGQHVVPYLFDTCGQCYYCRVGRHAQCTNLKGLLGVTTHGGFAEYFVTPSHNLFALPNTVPFDKGGLVSCAVITALHAFRRSRLGPNDTAVVIGAGGVAHPLIQILKAAGVRVVAVSRSQEKLDLAIRVGAQIALKSGIADAAEQVRRITGDLGAQCVFDNVGTSETMRDAASYVMRCGQIVVIGEEAEYPEIDSVHIAQRELEIIGSRNGSRQDCADAIAMMASGIIAPPISCTFPLEQINDALEHLRTGKAPGRIVVTIR